MVLLYFSCTHDLNKLFSFLFYFFLIFIFFIENKVVFILVVLRMILIFSSSDKSAKFLSYKYVPGPDRVVGFLIFK